MPIRRNSKPSATAVTWYLVRISPGAAPGYQIGRLSLPDMRSWTIQGVALSASGDELAMALTPAQPRPSRPGAADLLGGHGHAAAHLVHDRHRPPSRAPSPPCRAWRRLAAVLGGRRPRAGLPRSAGPPGRHARESGPQTERLLDVTASGGDLIADSRVIWTDRPPRRRPRRLLARDVAAGHPDAKTVVCPDVSFATLSGTGNNTHERITLRWLAYSVPAATARTLYQATVETKVASARRSPCYGPARPATRSSSTGASPRTRSRQETSAWSATASSPRCLRCPRSCISLALPGSVARSGKIRARSNRAVRRQSVVVWT